MSEALAVAPNPTEAIAKAEQSVSERTALFELAQREAKIYSESSLVPKEYQKNVGNVLIAQNMANRMGADTLMVMQNLYIVHGRPGWSSQFLISCFNNCGRFSAIKYRWRGEERTSSWGCQAYCTEKSTGEELSGIWITWEMANAEGWVNKSGSKWKTMPAQMMCYRAAAFFIRVTAPEIGMGLLTAEEQHDAGRETSHQPTSTATGVEGLKSRLAESVDAEILETSEAPNAPEPADVDESQRADLTTAIRERLNEAGTDEALAVEKDFDFAGASMPDLEALWAKWSEAK